MSMASWVGAAVLVWATIVTTWFLIVYSRRGPWWRPRTNDPHGEVRAHVGYFMLSLDLIFVIYDIRPLFDASVFAWVRVGLFALIAGMLTWRLWMAIKPDRRMRGVH